MDTGAVFFKPDVDFEPAHKAGYLLLPDFILGLPVSLGAKMAYMLIYHSAAKERADHVIMSQEQLSEALSCSISSLKNYLAELAKEKLIVVNRERESRVCAYYLFMPCAGKK